MATVFFTVTLVVLMPMTVLGLVKGCDFQEDPPRIRAGWLALGIVSGAPIVFGLMAFLLYVWYIDCIDCH